MARVQVIAGGIAVDRHRIEMQIRAVMVPYRIEARRRDSLTMHQFRVRARSILGALEDAARPYPDLAARLSEACEELDDDADPAQPAVGL